MVIRSKEGTARKGNWKMSETDGNKPVLKWAIPTRATSCLSTEAPFPYVMPSKFKLQSINLENNF